MKNDRPTDAGSPAPGEIAGAGEREALLDIFRHLELDDQVRKLGAHIVAWTGDGRVLAFVRGEDPQQFVPTGEGGTDGPPPEGEAVQIAKSKIERYVGDRDEVIEAGLPSFVPKKIVSGGAPPAHGWTLPVRDPAGALAGVIVHLGGSEPDPGSRERIRRLLDESRLAIANALAVRGIRELVFKDDTADCFNRRYFNEFLAEELSRATRFKAALSLIFFDMDNLKEVNSSLGHAAGSRAIFEVSQRVRAKIRRFDKLFRFGGDEFCIVLPETEWHGALEVAERVRESIAGKRLLTEKTGGKGVKMTASFGIASFPLHARSREELIHLADWAMQRIKRGTKNSIAIAEIAKPERS
jgi:diguanylate cyclase (GGDEF)-like protein